MDDKKGSPESYRWTSASERYVNAAILRIVGEYDTIKDIPTFEDYRNGLARGTPLPGNLANTWAYWHPEFEWQNLINCQIRELEYGAEGGGGAPRCRLVP